MHLYRHATDVEPGSLQGDPVFLLPRGGRVAADADVVAIWKAANGSTLEDVQRRCPTTGDGDAFVRAALACLAEAKLLQRDPPIVRPPSEMVPNAASWSNAPLVSAIIISYQSREWLDGSIGTVLAQRYPAFETLVVDNGSPDDPTPWVAERFPGVRTVRLEAGHSFAHAVNVGVAQSKAPYVLILNPDVQLDVNALRRLVAAAEAAPDCAAVAAKLTFWWAPAFLNGIGNRVDATSWGTDNFIGHLDLGQYDGIREVPSVCFAAALIRRAAWDVVGAADEGFPMYYEDTEWSYRARLLGYRIVAAPDATVQHVFGGQVRSGEESDLTPRKAGNAAYGRLRFALKICGRERLYQFARNYAAEDRANARAAFAQGHRALAAAYARAWLRVGRDLPSLLSARRRLQSARRVPDDRLFAPQEDLPPGLMRHGLPELTREAIVRHYLPLFLSGRTRAVPEFVRQASPAS
jgi:N-acetylglucosaminyl-diphospho-decaprenol L-rhamnosyltransferase